jgi:hypothetical protein
MTDSLNHAKSKDDLMEDDLIRATTAAASQYSYKNSNVEKLLSSIGSKSIPFKVKLPKLPIK